MVGLILVAAGAGVTCWYIIERQHLRDDQQTANVASQSATNDELQATRRAYCLFAHYASKHIPAPRDPRIRAALDASQAAAHCRDVVYQARHPHRPHPPARTVIVRPTPGPTSTVTVTRTAKPRPSHHHPGPRTPTPTCTPVPGVNRCLPTIPVRLRSH